MHQRETAKAAWTAAGVYQNADARLRQFLTAFEQCPADCWPALTGQVRDAYPRYKKRLASALWASGDKLLRLNLIRSLDPSRPDELNLMKTYLRSCDPATDIPEIGAFFESGHPAVVAQLAKIPALPAFAKPSTPNFHDIPGRPGRPVGPGAYGSTEDLIMAVTRQLKPARPTAATRPAASRPVTGTPFPEPSWPRSARSATGRRSRLSRPGAASWPRQASQGTSGPRAVSQGTPRRAPRGCRARQAAR